MQQSEFFNKLLEKITAKMLVIVFADDQINSPEFAALDREMPRVKNGRYVIVPVTKESDGEHNNLNGGIWGAHLRGFLSSSASAEDN